MRRPNIRGSQTSEQHDSGFRTPLLSYRWQVLSADPPAFNAWSLLSLTATAHGVLAYPDELGVRYVYDSTVPNGRYVTLGDPLSPWYAITATFFGAGWIDSIETASDRKIRYRCPNCTSTDFK